MTIMMAQQGIRGIGGGGGVPVSEAIQSSQSAESLDLTLVAPAGIIAGELLILYGMSETNGALDDDKAGWTKHVANVNQASIAMFYKIATGSEGNEVLHGGGSSKHVGFYERISGVDQDTPIHITPTFSGQIGLSLTIPEIITTNLNTLARFVMSYDGADHNPWSTVTDGWSITEQKQHSDNAASSSSGVVGEKAMVEAGATLDVILTTTGSSDGANYMQFAINPE